MTIQDLINWFGSNQNHILWYFGTILILTILSVVIVNKNNIGSFKYFLSFLVHAVTIPGILSVILILYALFIIKTNLLNVNAIAYFVPIIAMIATLLILNKKVRMNQIPGFSRLSALMLMIGIAFGIVFVLQNTFFGVFFVGGFSQLIIVFIVVLVLLKIAWSRFTK
ncbi:hypothetical protein GCM10022393_24960 [Aquimarina addita]|uniref:Uncharacterized protein n=1 Tax=Aquimarina addita TaxID=870485 RepID=A0ABP6UM04_9FLAO